MGEVGNFEHVAATHDNLLKYCPELRPYPAWEDKDCDYGRCSEAIAEEYPLSNREDAILRQLPAGKPPDREMAQLSTSALTLYTPSI